MVKGTSTKPNTPVQPVAVHGLLHPEHVRSGMGLVLSPDSRFFHLIGGGKVLHVFSVDDVTAGDILLTANSYIVTFPSVIAGQEVR